MKITDKRVTTPWFILICVAGILLGASAMASAPIWSNVVNTNVTQTAWTGTVTLNTLSGSYGTGQPIALTATLSPVPTTGQSQQTVVFYYSTMTSVSSTTPITGIPSTGLAYVTGNLATSSATTINGVAQVTLTPTLPGTYYFIAEIPDPI